MKYNIIYIFNDVTVTNRFQKYASFFIQLIIPLRRKLDELEIKKGVENGHFVSWSIHSTLRAQFIFME